MSTVVQTLQLVYRRLDQLIPYAANPRKNDRAVDRMCDSIREFGFRVPVLATSTGDIIDGHLRWKAARRLKLESVPVILCDDWSEVQIRAFRLLVNRSVTWAEWDWDLLSAELAALQESQLDLKLTGFDEAELQELLGPLCGLTDEDALVQPAAVAQRSSTYISYAAARGDLFIVRSRNSCINDPIRSTSSSNAKWPVS